MGHLGRVLIVDDDSEWREVVGDLLRDAGYTVTMAEDGRRALEMIAGSPPAVVMTDIQMPVMDGRQLLAQTHAVDGRLPVIVVSGEQGTDARLLPGAFRVLSKRGTPDDLLGALAAAMAHRADRMPLSMLWRASAEHPAVRQRPRPFASAIASAMSSYFKATSWRLAVAATVLVSALLVRKLIKA